MDKDNPAFADLSIEQLLAAGVAFETKGDASQAVAAWLAASRRGCAEGLYNIGLLYAQRAYATPDTERSTAYLQSAVAAFLPIAPAALRLPKAAFNLGMIAEDLAKHSLQAPDLDQEQQLETANFGFTKAATYYLQAAEMPDSLSDGTPAEAMLKLASFCTLGIGGFEKDEAAAQVWVDRAHATCPLLFEPAAEIPEFHKRPAYLKRPLPPGPIV